jgi:hypothetical protein
MSSGVGKYRLGPFLLESEIPLPELKALDLAVGTPDVTIRLGTAPERIENVVANETRWWASREEYLLRVPGVATLLVRHGREVIVQPAPGALHGDICAYLLSPVFSTLCYQAGMYSLHASAVRVGSSVVAFLGDSGAGKSTLAAYLQRRGYPIFSDDFCLLDTCDSHLDPQPGIQAGEQPGPTLMVVPVAPGLKLWRSALEQLGASPEGMPPVLVGADKYRMKLPPETDQRLPLREVLFLEWADVLQPGIGPPDDDSDGNALFTEIDGVHAIARLMEFTHHDYLMKPTGRQTGNFLLCGQILAQARAFAFRRPRSFDHIEPVVDALERHFASIGL